MPLKFHPNPGTLLVCDYSKGFAEPEMVKRRPVVVVSPRLKRRDGLCAVVPLSTSPPNPICDYHCEVAFDPPLPAPFNAPVMWAKADMLATVGFHRLDLHRTGRDHTGKRQYLTRTLSSDDMRRIQCALLHGLGLGALTSHIHS